MEDSRTFFDVTDATFDAEVIEASHVLPVVVDFWADWCEPCHALSPVLEKVVTSLAGQIRLAKLDIDKNPVTAQKFAITGVPTVLVFRDGQVVSEFVGLLPEAEVERFLKHALPPPEEKLVADAIALLTRGEEAAAKGKLEEAIRANPAHPRAHLELGKLALDSGDEPGAKKEFESVSDGTPEFDEAAGCLAMLEFRRRCRDAGGLAESRQKWNQARNSLEAKFQYALCLAAEGEYEPALSLLLQIVEADKTFAQGAAKETMVKIFSILGQRSPITDKYRTRLASILY